MPDQPTFWEVIASIGHGHASQKHLSEMTNPDYGEILRSNPPNSRQGLSNIILDVVNDPETKSIYSSLSLENGDNVDSILIYNERMNVIVQVNDSTTLHDLGTVYRVKNPTENVKGARGETNFSKEIERCLNKVEHGKRFAWDDPRSPAAMVEQFANKRTVDYFTMDAIRGLPASAASNLHDYAVMKSYTTDAASFIGDLEKGKTNYVAKPTRIKPPSDIMPFATANEAAEAISRNGPEPYLKEILGFDDRMIDLYERIPENLLDHIPEEEVLKGTQTLLEELWTFKQSVSDNPDAIFDAVDELRLRVRSPGQLHFDQATEIIGNMPAKATRFADNVHDFSSLATSIKTTLLTSRMMSLGSVLTVGLAVGLTETAHAGQLDMAEQMFQNGTIPNETLEGYREAMADIRVPVDAQALDVTPAALFTMMAAENYAARRFQQFSDEYGLTEQVHQQLSPTILPTQSVSGMIFENVYNALPEEPSETMIVLRGLSEAKQDLAEAEHALQQARSSFDTHQFSVIKTLPDIEQNMEQITAINEAEAQLANARETYDQEFRRVLQQEEQGPRAVALLLSEDDLISVIRSSAKYTPGDHDPLIAAYVNAQTEVEELADWPSAAKETAGYNQMLAIKNENLGEAENALREQPAVIRSFLESRLAARQNNNALTNTYVSAADTIETPVQDNDHLAGLVLPASLIPEQPEIAPQTLTSHPLPMDGQSVVIQETFQYTMIANSFARIQAGEHIDEHEQEQIENYIHNSENSTIDTQIIATLAEQFPEVMESFRPEEKPTVKAEDLSQRFRLHVDPFLSIPVIYPVTVTPADLEPLQTPLNRDLNLHLIPQNDDPENPIVQTAITIK